MATSNIVVVTVKKIYNPTKINSNSSFLFMKNAKDFNLSVFRNIYAIFIKNTINL